MLEDRIIHRLKDGPVSGSYGNIAEGLNASGAGVRYAMGRLLASGRVKRSFNENGAAVYELASELTVKQLLERIAELEAELAKLQKPKQKRVRLLPDGIQSGEVDRFLTKAIPIIEIPTQDGGKFGVMREFFDEMVRAYPGVDVLKELDKMRAWCVSNPSRRKTKQGMPRFINNWLSGAEKFEPKPKSVAERANIINDMGPRLL